MTDHLSSENFNSIVTGIVAGVFSSAIFLAILSRLKPNVSISNSIAKENFGGADLYIFKIINKSYFFKVYDVSLKIYSVRDFPSCNGRNEEIVEIKLRKDFQRLLHRFNFRHTLQDIICGESRLKSRTDYAAQFSTKEDIASIIEQNRHIEIEVYAKHPLTGFGKIFTKQYMHRSNISDGSFYSGNSFKIKS